MLMRASAMMSGLAPSARAFARTRCARRAAAHRLERPLGLADRAHAMVDAPRPEPPLRDLEAAPAAKDHGVLGQPDVAKADVHVAVRRVVVAIDLHRSQDLDALRRGGHEQHRMTRMRRGVGIGQRHGDIERAARIAGPGRPPFLAVEHPFLAFEPRVHGDVGRIRRGDAGLGHEIGGTRAPLEEIRQPPRLLLGRAEALDHLHVAGVGSGAIEDLRGERRPAHLLGEIGVFDGGEAKALVGAGEPEVPQALGSSLRLENSRISIKRLVGLKRSPSRPTSAWYSSSSGMISSRTIARTAAMSGRTLSVTPRSTCSSLEFAGAI